MACCLYEGATINDAECLEAPKREGVPVSGVPNAGEEPEEPEPEREKSGGKRRRSLFDRMKQGIAGYFSADDEGDSELD